MAYEHDFPGLVAWTSAVMRSLSHWRYHLDKAEISEIEAAMAAARGMPRDRIRREDFRLPRLGPSLARMREEVERGSGVLLLQGLPVERWGEDDSLRAFRGLCTHFGEISGQNRDGQVLAHVRSTGLDLDRDAASRGHQTSSFLPFHCDHGDTVALLCLQTALSGGESCIASAPAIHDAVVARRLDLVDLLYEPLYYDWREQQPARFLPYYPAPLFVRQGDRLFSRTGRKYIESAQRFDAVPRLISRQLELLDFVETLCASDEFRLDMHFVPGDVQILNNHTVMHSRAAYEDHPDPSRWRHLARILILSADQADLPASERHINAVTRAWRDGAADDR